MQWGFYLLNWGPFADPRTLVDLACAAEDAGWDGFFLADNLSAAAGAPVVDTWSTLAAIAGQTRRIRLGPLITALPRRHLGKLAREAVTLDHLSGGRLIQGVGSGDDTGASTAPLGRCRMARPGGHARRRVDGPDRLVARSGVQLPGPVLPD